MAASVHQRRPSQRPIATAHMQQPAPVTATRGERPAVTAAVATSNKAAVCKGTNSNHLGEAARGNSAANASRSATCLSRSAAVIASPGANSVVAKRMNTMS